MDSIPRIEIGSWPTPVRRLDATSEALEAEIWVKLENEAGVWGGNKVRKLEYLLAEASAKTVSTLCTQGAGSSSWAAAVALHGTDHGFEVVLGLAGPIPDHYKKLYRERKAVVHALPHLSLLPLAALRARASARGINGVFLPAGGSGGVGDIGSMGPGAEIATSVNDGALPRPSRVFVAAGTGGTSAGIAVGLGSQGLRVPVAGVRVTPRPLGTERLLRRRARALVERLESLGQNPIIPAPIAGVNDFFGGGYGRPTKESQEAIEIARADDIELDGIYAAKAFAALIAAARAQHRGPLLFIHTSPGLL